MKYGVGQFQGVILMCIVALSFTWTILFSFCVCVGIPQLPLHPPSPLHYQCLSLVYVSVLFTHSKGEPFRALWLHSWYDGGGSLDIAVVVGKWVVVLGWLGAGSALAKLTTYSTGGQSRWHAGPSDTIEGRKQLTGQLFISYQLCICTLQILPMALKRCEVDWVNLDVCAGLSALVDSVRMSNYVICKTCNVMLL